MAETVSTQPVDMDRVRAALKPWTAKDGSVRYYINNIGNLLDDSRTARGVERRSYYDWVEMRASYGRVADIIEGHILPNTKTYIDENGFIHVSGWAACGKGHDMGLDTKIIRAVNRVYGIEINKHVYKTRCNALKTQEYYAEYPDDNAQVGDVVRIVKGRKAVGDIFIITHISKYYPTVYSRHPTVYLHGQDGFKVNADNCELMIIGYSDVKERL